MNSQQHVIYLLTKNSRRNLIYRHKVSYFVEIEADDVE